MNEMLNKRFLRVTEANVKGWPGCDAVTGKLYDVIKMKKTNNLRNVLIG